MTITDAGLDLSATCTNAQFDRTEWPREWTAAPLVGACCRPLLGSFKIWNRVTVGGNLCTALPAGPMIALAAALDGICVLCHADGTERRLPVVDFVTGPQRTALRADEILRSIGLPGHALQRRTTCRRISLSPNGRSGAFLIGTHGADGQFILTVTASTPRPRQMTFVGIPAADNLQPAITAAIPKRTGMTTSTVRRIGAAT